MKPKEIISQLHLEKGCKGKAKIAALSLLMIKELETALREMNICREGADFDNDSKFDKVVRQIFTKWNAVSLKIPYGISDGAWSFFYAEYVIKLKEQLCPSWLARKQAYEQRKKEKEERQKKKSSVVK